MRTLYALLSSFVFFGVLWGYGYAAPLTEPKVIDDPDYLMYIPSGIDVKARYPLVVALSSDADAQSMIELWIGVSEKYKWIIFASKEYKNDKDIGPVLESIMSKLAELAVQLPFDPSKVVATGVGGGGMGAHALSFLYPKPILAIVVNVGIINTYFKERTGLYPYDKVAVFLASPTDFRYEQMNRDRKFLEGLGWKTKWIEFKGGHVAAPASAYMEAADWLIKQ